MSDNLIAVEVAYATASQQLVLPETVPKASTIASVIASSGICSRFPELSDKALTVGIFARICELSQTVNPGDRVEIYRPLPQDPKEARRQRAVKK